MSRKQRRALKKSTKGRSAQPEAAAELERQFAEAAVHHREGRFSEAEAGYRLVLAAVPRHAAALHNLGAIAFQTGDPDSAIGLYDQALAVDPNHVEAHVNRGNALKALHRFDDAITAYGRAIAIQPGHSGAHANRGAALQSRGRLDEALSEYREALKINPNHAAAHGGLGAGLLAKGDLDAAVASLEQALRLRPKYADAHSNLGVAFRIMGRLEDAVSCFRNAIEADPNHADAHFNLCLALFLLEKSEEAWPHYEWRWHVESNVNGDVEKRRDFPQPAWDGVAPKGKTILVWGEQGIGDEIMFAGLVPDLVDAGADVVMECDPRLVPLFQRSIPQVRCVGRSDPPDPETVVDGLDMQIPAGSLGGIYRATEADFPNRRSYLTADADLRSALRARYLDGHDALLVGLSWSSVNATTGGDRSVRLADYAPILGIPGVRAVNLQYGDTADERRQVEADLGLSIVHDSEIDSLKDLDGFAAQVAAMDLVISIDNSTVHMAGALGVPVWILLPRFLDCGRWQWMLERTDNPWYPSARLYRRNDAEDWSATIGRAASDLASLAGERTGERE